MKVDIIIVRSYLNIVNMHDIHARGKNIYAVELYLQT